MAGTGAGLARPGPALADPGPARRAGLAQADRLILEQIDSTNEEARRAARAGAPGPLWIMARRQTGGRGRRGRVWRAPPGNLNATLLMRPAAPPALAALYGFVAALAVADLLETCAPGAGVALKWPNDALLNGGKVAGILLESEGAGARLNWLAVGIGVNLAAHPDLPVGETGAHPPASLAAVCAPPDPETALDILAAAFARHAAALEREGFAPIRTAWLARAARLGQPIEARLPHETVSGIFRDIDAGGALVLATPEGERRFAAAEVHFPPPPPRPPA